MANFNQAIKWMKEGKKVKREFWSIIKFLKVCDSEIRYDNDEIVKMSCITDFEADDWEIFEEPKKTLSDKITHNFGNTGLCGKNIIDADNVKEFIKDFKEEIYNKFKTVEIYEIIDRLAGDKLK